MEIKGRAKMEKAARERIEVAWENTLVKKLQAAIDTQMTKGKKPNVDSPAIRKILAKAKEDAVAEVLNGFQAEFSDFYYNRPNDYGSISLRVYPGKGDPFEQYGGPEILSLYADGVRGGGYYTPTAKLAKPLLKQAHLRLASQEVLTQALKEKQAQKKAA